MASIVVDMRFEKYPAKNAIFFSFSSSLQVFSNQFHKNERLLLNRGSPLTDEQLLIEFYLAFSSTHPSHASEACSTSSYIYYIDRITEIEKV